MQHRPSPGYSITIRCEIENRIGMFARIAAAIGEAGGDLGSIDIVRVEKGKIIRDITVDARDEEHERQIVRAVKAIPGLKALRVLDKTFFAHLGGKIEIHNRIPVRDRNDLSKVYTPGVARVCLDIKENREHAWRYTIKGNAILIITDGTAVLGLGDIGPEAAMPVMEGKAMLFKEFGGVDAFPVALSTTDPDEIVNVVEKMAPAFGGINLEDISAPRCFDIETRLRRALDIPVFHDDQHGTAVIITAALLQQKEPRERAFDLVCGLYLVLYRAGLEIFHPGRGNVFKDALFVRRVAFYRRHEIGYQVESPFELDFNLRPVVFYVLIHYDDPVIARYYRAGEEHARNCEHGYQDHGLL